MKFTVKNTRLFITLLVLAFAIQTANAQCKSVVKEGIKKLAPYTHNGQVNNTTLEDGKPTEVHLSFYKGLSYKLQFCSDESLGKVTFRVLDENKTEVFNSASATPTDSWTFYSNSSQELVVEIVTTDKSKKGCAAVLVGMQVPKSNSLRNL